MSSKYHIPVQVCLTIIRGMFAADTLEVEVQLVKIVFNGEGQESVTAGCRHSLSYLHTCLVDSPKDLSGPWLSLAVSVIILLVQHKAEPVCQAWMMAILSHLAGKIVNNILIKFPELEVKEIEEDEDTISLDEADDDLGVIDSDEEELNIEDTVDVSIDEDDS